MANTFGNGMNLGQLLRQKMNQALGIPVKRTRSKYELLKKYQQALRRKGWYEIQQSSMGIYTQCLMLSPDGTKVCKISPICSDFYPEYIKWVCRNSGKHFPKIYSARSICKNQYFMVIMERLNPLPADNKWDLPDDLQYVSAITRYTVDFQKLAAYGMGSIIRDLTKLFTDIGNFTDCHYGNMMLRNDGTLVFTDPYCEAPNGKNVLKLEVLTDERYLTAHANRGLFYTRNSQKSLINQGLRRRVACRQKAEASSKLF